VSRPARWDHLLFIQLLIFTAARQNGGQQNNGKATIDFSTTGQYLAPGQPGV
jgi:hypothetical protein